MHNVEINNLRGFLRWLAGKGDDIGACPVLYICVSGECAISVNAANRQYSFADLLQRVGTVLQQGAKVLHCKNDSLELFPNRGEFILGRRRYRWKHRSENDFLGLQFP